MTCDGCAKDVSGALHKLPGITKVEANVKDQLVSVEGTGSCYRAAPPGTQRCRWDGCG
jgi:copper chaperone CopZ